MSALKKAVSAIDKGFGVIEKYITAVALVIFTIVIFCNVVGRYLLLSAIPWAEELSRYLSIFLVFIAISAGIKSDLPHWGGCGGNPASAKTLSQIYGYHSFHSDIDFPCHFHMAWVSPDHADRKDAPNQSSYANFNGNSLFSPSNWPIHGQRPLFDTNYSASH